MTGVENPSISDTLCDPANVEALPPLTVDEPTVSMTFQVNTSPFAGKEEVNLLPLAKSVNA